MALGQDGVLAYLFDHPEFDMNEFTRWVSTRIHLFEISQENGLREEEVEYARQRPLYLRMMSE